MPHPEIRHAMSAWLSLCALAIITGKAQAYPFYAPPPPKEDAPRFAGDAELGFTHLSGNTDSKTLIGKGRLIWLTGDWTHTLRGEVRNVSRNGGTSAEQYIVAGRERYELDGPHYVFGFARWEKDRFSGYDQQATAIGGYGRDLIDSERHLLSLEGGPGFRHDRLDDGTREFRGVAYGAMAYEWAFSEHSSVEQELSVEATSENVTSRSLSSLTARINAHLALKLSHEVKDNSNPPDSADARTDQTTSASLLYSW